MDRVFEFAGNHAGLVFALFAVLAAIVFTEWRRKAVGVRGISSAEAVRMVNDDDALMLDVREAAEYKGGHILDSVHIPLSKLAERVAELEKYKSANRPIIAYCRSGARSMTACGTLRKHGFEQLFNLAGGIAEWQHNSLPVTTRDKPAKPAKSKSKKKASA